ncbi:hypothetical protein V8E53_007078 [Lactarius tabidus]
MHVSHRPSKRGLFPRQQPTGALRERIRGHATPSHLWWSGASEVFDAIIIGTSLGWWWVVWWWFDPASTQQHNENRMSDLRGTYLTYKTPSLQSPEKATRSERAWLGPEMGPFLPARCTLRGSYSLLGYCYREGKGVEWGPRGPEPRGLRRQSRTSTKTACKTAWRDRQPTSITISVQAGLLVRERLRVLRRHSDGSPAACNQKVLQVPIERETRRLPEADNTTWNRMPITRRLLGVNGLYRGAWGEEMRACSTMEALVQYNAVEEGLRGARLKEHALKRPRLFLMRPHGSDVAAEREARTGVGERKPNGGYGVGKTEMRRRWCGDMAWRGVERSLTHAPGRLSNRGTGCDQHRVAQLLVAVCTERSPPHVCVQACVFNRSAAMTQFADGGTGKFGYEGTEAERRAEQGPNTEPRNGTKDNYGQRRLHVNSSPTTEDMCMKGLGRAGAHRRSGGARVRATPELLRKIRQVGVMMVGIFRESFVIATQSTSEPALAGVTVLSSVEFQTDHWTNKDVLHAMGDWTGPDSRQLLFATAKSRVVRRAPELFGRHTRCH